MNNTVTPLRGAFSNEAIHGKYSTGLLRYACNDDLPLIIMGNIRFLFIFISLYFSAGNIHALDGISIGSGPAGAAGINSIHFGLEKTWTKQWFEDCPWNVRGYWDLSFYTMRRPHKENFETNNKIQAIAISPVFRFYKTEPVLQSKVFYIELAVGLAQMNKRSIGQRELGINFQFEDRLGAGLRFGKQKQYDLNYRVVHFSNAYIGHKNHGINLHLLSINYWFT